MGNISATDGRRFPPVGLPRSPRSQVKQHQNNQCPTHRRYLLHCPQFDGLRAEVGYACQICGTPEAETAHGRLVIDHDPELGYWAIRGLLCGTCNTSLGRDPERLPAAAGYLAQAWHVRAGLNYLPVPVPDIPLLAEADALRLLTEAKGRYLAAEGGVTGDIRSAREDLKHAVRVATKAGIRQCDIVLAIDRIWTRELVSYRLQERGRWVVRNVNQPENWR
ncbi:endonuclease domain-containing protein [Micromonospora sp. NPDC053740]|uniref:endonuclease domain-containing protein n=1 Tax=Micromonospora sp. NPDC053740 TaxID=3155173 RepID=UPI00344A27FF